MELDKAITAICNEYVSASSNFPAFNSHHEGYAVILEELDELKSQVWLKQSHRSLVELRKEAMHVSVMALRFMVDLT